MSTTASTSSTTAKSKVYVPKAKCPENQHLVQVLAEKKHKCEQMKNGGSNFKYTLKAAMDNLCKTKEVVGTYKQALQVKGIGSKLAHILFPNDDHDSDNQRSSSATSTAAAAAKPTTKSSNPTSRKRKAGAAGTMMQDSSPQVSVSSTATRTALASVAVGPSAKQIAYERAKALAERQTYRGQSLQWKVVFLVDDREKKQGRELLSERFSMSNIPYEVRHLPIGDMTWVAQGRVADKNNNNNSSSSKVVVELVLGTMIERKTLDDLVASIHGTRYAEQRMRLKDSGLSQCLLLVEGELHRDSTLQEANNQRLEKCHTAIWETSLHMGLHVIRTKDLTDTIQVLRRLHRRILFRSFPVAFYDETLPAFTEPSASGEHRHRQQQPQQLQQRKEELGQRRRRRYQSLHELVFDTEPTPPEGMDRFVTYEELKAKVEYDKEAGLNTVKMLHAAMIKQVARVESKKCAAILDAYPTPTQLFAAYEEVQSASEKELLVRDLDTAEPDTKCRKCTVGLQSSKNLYIAYGMSQEASKRPSYTDRVREVQNMQKEASSRKSSQDDDGDEAIRLAAVVGATGTSSSAATAASKRRKPLVPLPPTTVNLKKPPPSRPPLPKSNTANNGNYYGARVPSETGTTNTAGSKTSASTLHVKSKSAEASSSQEVICLDLSSSEEDDVTPQKKKRKVALEAASTTHDYSFHSSSLQASSRDCLDRSILDAKRPGDPLDFLLSSPEDDSPLGSFPKGTTGETAGNRPWRTKLTSDASSSSSSSPSHEWNDADTGCRIPSFNSAAAPKSTTVRRPTLGSQQKSSSETGPDIGTLLGSGHSSLLAKSGGLGAQRSAASAPPRESSRAQLDELELSSSDDDDDYASNPLGPRGGTNKKQVEPEIIEID